MVTGRDETTSRCPRWGVGDAFAVLVGAQVLGFVWASSVLGARYGSDPIPFPPPIAIGVLANVGLWLGYGGGSTIVARVKGEGPVIDYGLRIKPLDVPLGLGLGVLLQLVVVPLVYWPILRLVDGEPGIVARQMIDQVDGPFEAALLVLSAVVIAPAVEELYYRGLALRSLEHRFGPAVAVVVSSVVFGLVHQPWLAVPGLFVFAVLVGLAAIVTGRLGLAWAMHVGFNLTTLIGLGLLS